jgi:predicted transposase YdaD
MGIWVDDISNIEDPVLRARALAPFPSLAIAAFRDTRRPAHIAPLLHAWAKALRALARARDGRRALEQLFRYIALVAKDLDRGEFEQEVAQLLSSKEVSIVTTMFEKAMQEGRDKGLREGRDKGLREGQARVLVRQLELKFGTLSTAARHRVERATLPTLSRWAERILTAKSVRQVLDG